MKDQRKEITFCEGCEFKTTDGCGPGKVMVCGHPSFKNAKPYEDAIIQWIWVGKDRELVDKNRKAGSYSCPKSI